MFRSGLWASLGEGEQYGQSMPSRGRHQSSSKECLRAIHSVIIGRSYGGKSLGNHGKTGSIRVQRKVPGGLKAVTQSSKGLQELFIRTKPEMEQGIWSQIEELT